MDSTPKLQRKRSLSLSTRLNQKRHSASPQNRIKTSTTNCAKNSRELNCNYEALQRSSSMMSISSDGGIECTPPHKKVAMNLDESLDFSPKIFDSSFSPTCLLSQTLAIDSPEVGWKWTRNTANGDGCGTACVEISSISTPDSACAADGSFASDDSSTTYKRRGANQARRDQRKILELEYRRVEKARAEEKLKQRCAKLQEQLKSAETERSKANDKSVEENAKISVNKSLNDVEIKSQSSGSMSTKAAEKLHAAKKLKKPELYNDFFNDSASDCFLLEATQEIESQIESTTQPASIIAPTTHTTFKCNSFPQVNSTLTDKSIPTDTKTVASIETNKNKRSSFYMKFLEDDCADDWFISLDEATLQTSQNKIPRTPLQRYKSMPAATAVNSNITLNDNSNCTINSNINFSKRLKGPSENMEASSSTFSKIKRHSSTHTLNPAGTNYRSRRQL